MTDILLPQGGDTLKHNDRYGLAFRAEELGRHFDCRIEDGGDIEGSIAAVISMKRILIDTVN